MKTDAFVSRFSDLEKSYELIECGNDFGCWRKSKDDSIILPIHPLQQKDNHAITI